MFLANLGWLVLLVPGLATRSDTAVDFWQIYFLTLPHRWLTLVLVLSRPGPPRRARPRCWSVSPWPPWSWSSASTWGPARSTCLALVDYVWNAWHFAAQHAGVLRMYTRKVGGGPDLLERWGTRAFITYAALRTAGWATGWLEADVDALAPGRGPRDARRSRSCSWSVTLARLNRQTLGKTAYVLSMCGLYSGLILALSYRQGGLVVVFATASSLFHAVEYMAVVTHYAQRRRTVGSPGRVPGDGQPLAADPGRVCGGPRGDRGALDRPDSGLRELWLGANLWTALVHYAYDGMIWKLRRPETAKALGVVMHSRPAPHRHPARRRGPGRGVCT